MRTYQKEKKNSDSHVSINIYADINVFHVRSALDPIPIQRDRNRTVSVIIAASVSKLLPLTKVPL